ncbi:MAG: hypothetical protein KGL53_12950, partial [Elusimicrobia bacterium]|nr:hypothetical protein [Elusimicrobiota bacterium]
MRASPLLRAALALLLVTAARAQVEDAGGDVLTAHDDHGDIAAVYNEFDGRAHSLQVVRLTARGDTVWNVLHSDGNYEKAYAAAMDSQADVLVAGTRVADGARTFLVLEYDHNGNLSWETVGEDHDCTAMFLAVDRDDNAVAAGVCRQGNSTPILIAKYSPDGRELWTQTYDGGGRNYLHALQVDYSGNAMLTVETVFGDYRDGSYAMRTAVFSPQGRQLDV